MTLPRRKFLGIAATGAAAGTAAMNALAAAVTSATPSPMAHAMRLGDQLVGWQSPYGSTDIEKCPFRSPPGTPTIAVVQGMGPQVRALYQLYDATKDPKYRDAADRYAVFVLSTLHEPPTPVTNMVEILGKTYTANSSAWVYGKALSPCYEWFIKYNPEEDLLNLKANAIYRWLQGHRRDDSYFGVGYANGEYPDAQFSCDLGEVGTGLVGFYKVSGDGRALDDAKGLAKYFMTEHEPGSARGVWSSKLGTWLVGPWPGGGAEHFTAQQYDQVGWGWSCLVVGEFLLELRKLIDDSAAKQKIGEQCVSALGWCLDNCQFEDGAHGMFGRDDKWVGQTAAAVLLYSKLVEDKLIPEEFDEKYRPKIAKSWKWLVANTAPEAYPPGGYIKVTGATTTKPPENLLWMMAWTIEALLAGNALFKGQA